LRPPRLAINGPRRVHQGLGPFVARDLCAAGAVVAGVLGTSAATSDAAARELADRFGIDARPYVALDALLEREAVDGLVILSPSASHETWLARALEAGLHVLCEKPLVWGGEGIAARAAELVEGFRARRLLLAENCQWPFGLPAFRALHPDLPEGLPTAFAMHLAPANPGERSLGDSLPHPLSLLQALAPAEAPRLEGIRIASHSATSADLDLAFDYVVPGGRVPCEIRLRQHASIPRPAGFSVGGRRAERHIAMPGYRMELRDGSRCVPLADPLTARVAAFCSELCAVLEGRAPTDPAPILRRMEMLECLVAASRSQGRA
jgi:hypothetical protein